VRPPRAFQLLPLPPPASWEVSGAEGVWSYRVPPSTPKGAKGSQRLSDIDATLSARPRAQPSSGSVSGVVYYALGADAATLSSQMAYSMPSQSPLAPAPTWGLPPRPPTFGPSPWPTPPPQPPRAWAGASEPSTVNQLDPPEPAPLPSTEEQNPPYDV
jgi:hypothetical protein